MPGQSHTAIVWIGALAVAGLVAASVRIAVRTPLSAPASAFIPGPEPASPGRGSAERVFADHPDCGTATNDCQICRRDGAVIACSTPGIACQPAAWRCQ